MSIKINRAKKIVKMLPEAEKVVWGNIPQELVDRLTGNELALVCQAMDSNWHSACKFTEQQILNEGVIYNPKTEKLIELKELKD